MKKYISLLSFIAIFFIGMQQSQAQETRAVGDARPEAIAKQQTFELHQLVALTGDQQAATYKVLVDLAQNLKGLEGNDNLTAVQEAKAFLSEKAQGQLKNILSKEQFQAYLKTLEKPKE